MSTEKKINTMQKRVAYVTSGLAVREGEGQNEAKTLSGVAIVIDKETTLYEGSDYREIEVIDPEALNEEWVKGQDVKLNLLHDRSLSIARSKAGKGTLQLSVEKDGLHFEAPVPDCDLGKRAVALIDNGTYTGCSFEFWAKDYEVTERLGGDGKTEYVIRHKAFERLGAVTIGMDPAYEQTSVKARELMEEKAEILRESEENAPEAGNVPETEEKPADEPKTSEEPQTEEKREAEEDERELQEQAERARRERQIRLMGYMAEA